MISRGVYLLRYVKITSDTSMGSFCRLINALFVFNAGDLIDLWLMIEEAEIRFCHTFRPYNSAEALLVHAHDTDAAVLVIVYSIFHPKNQM